MMVSYTGACDAHNRQLEKEGKYYRFSYSGYPFCFACHKWLDEFKGVGEMDKKECPFCGAKSKEEEKP